MRLVVSYQSLVQARGRAAIIIIHYCGSSGSSAKSVSPSLKSRTVRKSSRMAIVYQWHLRTPAAATPSKKESSLITCRTTTKYIIRQFLTISMHSK